MGAKSDRWIRRMAKEHGMIAPFEPGMVREVDGRKGAWYSLNVLNTPTFGPPPSSGWADQSCGAFLTGSCAACDVGNTVTTVGIFDARDLKAPQRVLTVGRFPLGFAFSQDGKSAIGGNHDDGTVSGIDLAAATITKTVPAGAGVETLTYY